MEKAEREKRWLKDGRLATIPAFDGLRGAAALGVYAVHVGTPYFGVGGSMEVFFVLSGCVITLMLLTSYNTGQFEFGRFYRNRFVRIYPPVFVLLLVAAPLAPWLQLDRSYSSFGLAAIGALTFSTNWQLLAFPSSSGALALLWSLAIEEQFYLTWPVALAHLIKRVNAGVILGGLAGVAALSMILREWLWHFVPYPKSPTAYLMTFTRMDGLALGCALGFGYWTRSRDSIKHPLTLTIASILGCVVLIATLPADRVNHQWFLYRIGFTLWTLSAVAIVASVLYVPGSLIPRLLNLRWLRALGKASYSLYIVHLPIIWLTRASMPHVYAHFRYRILIVTALTALATWVLHTRIANPSVRRWRRSPARADAAEQVSRESGREHH